jgi:hypothetical protein
MNRFECSPRKPWGIHAPVRNDEQCGRCGWTAPGPRADARTASARLSAAIAAEHGWTIIEGGAACDDEVAPDRAIRAA